MRRTNGVQLIYRALHSRDVKERQIIQIAKSLSKKELDVQDDDGNTALHLAAIKGYANLCERLVALGASYTVRNDDGVAAMDLLAAP